jgi:hypothetical protein
MERRSERSDSTRSETIVDVRTSLALWLRAGRTHRGMSLEDVAKVTKIQPRILERLEAGRPDGLPADVFVRGFVRSFARCVGLDEEEALRRYAACGLGGLGGAPGQGGAPSLGSLERPAGMAGPEITTARALVEAMADLVPGSATAVRATPRRMHAVEVIDLAAGSLRDLQGAAIVETMMLPETGTVVQPVQPVASLAEAMTDSEPISDPRAASPSVADAAGEAPPVAAPTRAFAVEPAGLIGGTGEPDAPGHSAESARSTEPPKKKRARRGKGRNKRATGDEAGLSRDLLAVGTPAGASPIVTETPGAPGPGESRDSAVTAAVVVAPVGSDAIVPEAAGAAVAAVAIDEPIATATWAPKMPPIAAAPSVPWRKPAYAASSAVAVPSLVLVIDDADPDSAERLLEERAEKHAPRRSFLPPILLDREDRSARQGGLTLAVIILLIAATLTLSYLMRRPSAGGDGMTRRETPAGTIGSPARG